MKCLAKHTKFQVPDKEFKCPKCEMIAGDFCIEESFLEADENCSLLHPDDFLKCYHCGFDTSGQAFSNHVKKALSMVPCTHCKGTGFVKKG